MILSPSYTKNIREAIAEFESEGVLHFTLEMIRERLEANGLANGRTERRRVGDAVKQMKMKGELVLDASGLRYNPQGKIQPMYEKIYRVIRAHKGGFTAGDISTLSESPLKCTQTVIASLTSSGYLKEAGYKEGKKVWVATTLCRNEPQAPPINYGRVDYEVERRAAARVVDVLLVSDPKHPAARKVITEQLDILNRRFGMKDFSNDSQKD